MAFISLNQLGDSFGDPCFSPYLAPIAPPPPPFGPPCCCASPCGGTATPFVPVPVVPPGTAYGGLYNGNGDVLSLPAGESVLPLPEGMDFINVRYGDNTIEVFREAIYEVTIALRGVATVNGAAATGTFGLTARADGIAFPQLSFSGSSASGDLTIMGTAPVRLRRGSVVDLAVTAPYAGALTLREGNGASLILRRIAAVS